VFGFSASTCYSQGSYTVNLCTTSGGLYNNGEELKEKSVDSSNVFKSAVKSSLGGGYQNSVIGDYATIGGGSNNRAGGDYAAVGGGYKSKANSNYALVLGGFQGQSNGRFGMVAGGSKNLARGRFSMALGFSGDASGDYSAALSFNGGDTCETSYDNEFAICADKVTVNGLELFPYSRRTLEMQEQADHMGDENSKKLDALREMTAAQEKSIEAREKLIGELQQTIRLLSEKVPQS
jgi:hypothetical protein